MSITCLPAAFARQLSSACANVWPCAWMMKSTWHVVPPNAAEVCPDFDVVDRHRPAERHVEMRVRVDAAR
jgi:hypothetical protein